MKEQLLGTVEQIKELAGRLSECQEVTRYDLANDKEAWALADGFSDIEEAFRAFLDEHLPKLMNQQVRGPELVEVLLDIGEEFRTILWHINEPKFYGYLKGAPVVGDISRGTKKE